MKKLLLQTLACAAVLLPFSQAQAKTYGGFKPGKTFTFTVKEAISIKAVGFNKPVKAPVPAGVPKFNKGKKVTFKIGTKGQLIVDGVSIPYKTDGGSANAYIWVKTGAAPATNSALVYKNSSSKPLGVALTFIRAKYSGFTTTTNTVTYTLN
jgi:hypothetical protein